MHRLDRPIAPPQSAALLTVLPAVLPAILLAVLVAVLAGGCATPPPRRESQAIPGVDLAAYRSFGWSAARAAPPAAPAEGAPAEGAPAEAAEPPPLRIQDLNIRNAVRAELTRRGYVEDEVNPELRVDYETAAADKLRSSPVRIGIGMGSWGGNVGGSVSMGTPSVESYQEGQLVLHILDVAKNQEVWYGSVSGRVDQKSLDPDTVARLVALALEDFPVSRAGPAPPQ